MNASIYDYNIADKPKLKVKPKDTNAVQHQRSNLSILTDAGFEVRFNRNAEWTPKNGLQNTIREE